MLDTGAVWTSASGRNCYNSLNERYVLCACTRTIFLPYFTIKCSGRGDSLLKITQTLTSKFICKNQLLKNRNCTYLRCTTWWFDIHTHSQMITAVKLINIAISSHRYHFFLFYFCCGGENTWNHSSSKLPVFI